MNEFEPFTKHDARLLKGSTRPDASLTVFQAFSIVIAGTIGFGLAGLAIGYGLGLLAPGYYRAVFRRGNDPDFEPTHVGIGLGLSQGLICGLLVGIAVVLAVGFSRRQRPAS